MAGCTDGQKKTKKKNTTHDINRAFLLAAQFPYVHDQPLAVLPVVNGFHFHHGGLDSGFILLGGKKVMSTG